MFIEKTDVKGRAEQELTRASSAAAVSAFNDPTDFKLALGDSADAVRSKVCVSGLNTAQAAEVLIALLLPLCYEVFICISLLYTVLIQLSADGFSLVEQIKNVSTPLMMKSENRPERLNLPLSFVRLCLSFSHFLIQLV